MSLSHRTSWKKVIIFTMALALTIATIGMIAPSPNALAASLPEWEEDEVYWGGDQVQYNEKTYEAKWWTKGDVPDKAVSYLWETPWELKDTAPNPNPNPTPNPTPNPNPNPTPAPGNVVYPNYSGVDVGQGIEWPDQVFAPFVDATRWPLWILQEKQLI